MKEELETFRANDCNIVVVTPSQPGDIREVVANQIAYCNFVGDPGYEVYRAFGLCRGKVRMFFSPRILGAYLAKMWSGWRIRKPRKGEDLLQLGGDFVLDSSRRLAFIHRSADPTDRPTVQQLLNAVTSLPAYPP